MAYWRYSRNKKRHHSNFDLESAMTYSGIISLIDGLRGLRSPLHIY